jgi:hypothetical protein
MSKKLIIYAFSFVILISAYSYYCANFWESYINTHSIQFVQNEVEEYNIYNFYLKSTFENQQKVTKDNFTKFTWSRQLVEPHHSEWVNDVDLSFPNDSTMLKRVTGNYISENFFTYPIFRQFLPNTEVFESLYGFKNSSMSFTPNGTDTIKIKIQNNKLLINYTFL